jgi:hypothetical protein
MTYHLDGDPERPAARSIPKWVVLGVDSYVFVVRELEITTIFLIPLTCMAE